MWGKEEIKDTTGEIRIGK